MLNRFVMACIASLCLAGSAMAKPPLSAFADLPGIRSPDISPDGKAIAYISRIEGVDYLAKFDVATGKNEALIRIPDVKAQGVYWVGSKYIILRASKIANEARWRLKFEDSAAFAYNVETRKIVQLLTKTKGLYPYQSGLGRIVGIDPDGQHVYMPAYMADGETKDLLKVNLNSGMGDRAPGGKGSKSTLDWIVDDSAKISARVDFNDEQSLYEIRVPNPSGGWRTIYSETTKDPSLVVAGLARSKGSLVAMKSGDSNFSQMYEISLADGAFAGPLHTRTTAEVETLIFDQDKIVMGASYSGLYPSYEFFDGDLNRDIKAAIAALPDSSVSVVSWTDDWSRIIFYADGGKQPPRFMMFDRKAKSLSQVASARPDIKPEEIGEVTTVEYKARDGLTIPALITWPVGVARENRKNLPMIVMPHGGPESYDSVSFDWLAQFFANEGYVVLQPNFRGSGGFGAAFATAGYGEWGRKMQHDVTDGAQALFQMGWADAKRTCIVGWSYGGYSALAGGALTPDLYKCVVSIAGVSDLRAMLTDERRDHGVFSPVYNYWKNVIGDPVKNGDAIDAVSPSHLAASFKAPVLLIHGNDDLVVPARQSDMMQNALKAAGKQVTYLRIGKDDHGLVAPESRTKALSAISEFLTEHIGE